MGRVIMPSGNYAEAPYYFENIGIKVYSLEEMAYVLKDKAFLLDKELLDKRLTGWIANDLNLQELADSLERILRRRGEPADVVRTIFEYTGFYDEAEYAPVVDIYRKGANLSGSERQKTRTDYLAENGRNLAALYEYTTLMDGLPENEQRLRAVLYHNRGVLLCRMFMFENAAEQFRLSYETRPETDTLKAWLSALRMYMTDTEYMAFLGEHPDFAGEAQVVEQEIAQRRKEWEMSPERKELEDSLERRKNSDSVLYYADCERRVRALQNKYREQILT